MNNQLKHTSLYQEHLKSGGKMVTFAGYSMPVEYEGIKTEHLWTREHAGIFDVSHMGQALITGPEVADFFMRMTPSNFKLLEPHKAKYTVLTNDQGGIIDDCIITNLDHERYFIVYNAGCKDKDTTWIKRHLPQTLHFKALNEHSLIALQGPKSLNVLQTIFTSLDLENQPYMTLKIASFENHEIFISRLGYTGEDGFEISIPSIVAPTLWQTILNSQHVKPIGLGARDSLRLEAGYPLYSQDLDETTSPIEANLSWIVRKKEANFIGAERIHNELTQGTTKLRVGIILAEKGIVRQGAIITNSENQPIGTVTSGGFGPSVNRAIAQGYVDAKYSTIGTDIGLLLRGRSLRAQIGPLSFITPRTKTHK